MDEFDITVDTYRQIWVNYGLGLSAIVIVFFDWLLVLTDEITHVWLRKLNTASYLYISIRYLSLAVYAPTALSLLGSGLPQSTCSILRNFHLYASLLIQCFTAVVFILRIHALYRNRRMAISLIVFCCVVLVVAVALIAVPFGGGNVYIYANALPGCNPLESASESKRYAIVWSGVSVFDLIIAYLTAKKALQAHGHSLSDLWFVFMRDGFVYFIILFVANTANILTFVLASPVLRGALGVPTTALEATLVCRLILNLRVSDAERRSAAEEMVSGEATELRVVVHKPAPVQTKSDLRQEFSDVDSGYLDRLKVPTDGMDGSRV